jgi:hypothetical protein
MIHVQPIVIVVFTADTTIERAGNTVQLLRLSVGRLRCTLRDPLYFQRNLLKRSPTPGHGAGPLPSGIPNAPGADEPFFR